MLQLEALARACAPAQPCNLWLPTRLQGATLAPGSTSDSDSEEHVLAEQPWARFPYNFHPLDVEE